MGQHSWQTKSMPTQLALVEDRQGNWRAKCPRRHRRSSYTLPQGAEDSVSVCPQTVAYRIAFLVLGTRNL